MDRTTNIINDAEVAHAMAMSSQGKKQAKNRKKPTDGGAFSFKASKKPSGTITANKGAKTAANMIMSRGPRARFYEENGLKIPLYDNDGQGTRRRLHARLAKSLLNRSAENLLDIVEQYAGADKKQELRNKRLSKLKLATWIEEKETLALGRNPKSTLAIVDTNQNGTDDAARPVNPTPPTLAQQVKRPVAPTPTTNITRIEPEAVVEDDRARGDFGRRKRSMHDEAPVRQPSQKHQKREHGANMGTIDAGQSSKKTPIDKANTETIPQTSAHINVDNDTETASHCRSVFMQRLGLDAHDPDRSSLVVRGDSKDHVITATSKSPDGPVYFFETTIESGGRGTPVPPSVPFLNPGKHGRHGDFIGDPDRRTGHGHRMEPDDSTKWERYKEFERNFERGRCSAPKPGEGIAIAAHRSKEARAQWQKWYDGFLEKYPGYGVAHLWPCGCEVMSDGTESEEE